MSCDICKLDHATVVCSQQTGYGLGNKPVANRIIEAIVSRDKDWVEWAEKHLILGPDALFKDCIIIHPSEWKERKRSLIQ